MLAYSTPHTVRVEIIPGSVYCLIVSDPDNTRSFYLINQHRGDPVHMFSCTVGDDLEAVEMAASNAPDYIDEI